MIELTRGDTQNFKFQRQTVNNEVINIKADEVTFTVKKNYYDSKIVLQKKLSEGNITFDDDFYYHFKITHNDTKELSYGKYVFDIEIRYDEEVKTPLKGLFFIKEEVTFDE